MIYAPIMIPTLCRYEHFRKLIESLQKCPEAKETDLYIGLDYPAKESHWDGYRKIAAYVDTINGFKNVIIFKHDHNLGADENITALREVVLKKYDCWIFSEDDNVVSPNFLAFIDKGLEKFKDDSNVFAICGYRHFYNVKFADNNFFRQNVDFSAWGYGVWKDKYDKFRHLWNKNYLKSKAKNLRCLYRAWRNGWEKINNLIRYAYGKKEVSLHDKSISLLMALENMDVVMPKISMIRNEGWDNSGLHCMSGGNLAERHTKQKIDDNNTFVYQGTGLEFYKQNRKAFVKENYAFLSWIGFVKQIIKSTFTRTCI
jgi:hypothetical protein